jgi:hypothetical protein
LPGLLPCLRSLTHTLPAPFLFGLRLPLHWLSGEVRQHLRPEEQLADLLSAVVARIQIPEALTEQIAERLQDSCHALGRPKRSARSPTGSVH